MLLTPSNTPEFSPIGMKEYYIIIIIYNRKYVWICKKETLRYGV